MLDITKADVERRFYDREGDPLYRLYASDLRDSFAAVAEEMLDIPAGREKSLAYTALEEASFWVQAALAREGS